MEESKSNPTLTPTQMIVRKKNWLKYCLHGAAAGLCIASKSTVLSKSVRRNLDKAAKIVSEVLNNW